MAAPGEIANADMAREKMSDDQLTLVGGTAMMTELAVTSAVNSAADPTYSGQDTWDGTVGSGQDPDGMEADPTVGADDQG